MRKGPLWLRFHAASRTDQAADAAQRRKLYPVSWEEAAQEAAKRLHQIYAAYGADGIGFIGSNRTSNEENYLLQRLARGTFGTNNIDHHRTADYTGLITALGDRRGRFAR